MRRSAAWCVIGAIALAGSEAAAQSCYSLDGGVAVETFLRLEYETNAQSATGEASGLVAAIDLLINNSWEPCGGYVPTPDPEVEGDAVEGPLAIHADAATTPDHFFNALASWWFSCAVQDGLIEMYTRCGAGVEEVGTVSEDNGYRIRLGLSAALQGSEMTFNFGSGSIYFLAWLDFVAGFDFWEEELYSGTVPIPSLSHVVFFDATLSDGSSFDRNQGLFAIFEDGTYTRLGFFDESEFEPEARSDGFDVDSGDVTIPFSLPGSGPLTATLTLVEDHFTNFDGNMNPATDDDVCWTDRVIMRAALGAAIGDEDYNPRGDFDLDGDIDTSDLGAFNAIGCTADVNCSGTLNINDYTAYQTKYNAHELAADMNGDGNWNINDYIAFQATFNQGCN